MDDPEGPGPARAGTNLHLLAWPVFLLFLVSPCSAWPGQGETFVVSLGLSSYRPSLKEVRQTLQQAGGGKLTALDDYLGESVHLAVALAPKPQHPGAPTTLREFSYGRYRARSASQDYLVEIEQFTGALVRLFRGKTQAKLQAYWGGGPALIRMKREGALTPRGAPALTQKDWLVGLTSFVGLASTLSPRLSLDLRYLRSFVPATTFNNAEYQLGGQGLVYALALRF